MTPRLSAFTAKIMIAITATTLLASCNGRNAVTRIEGFGIGTTYSVTVVGDAPADLREQVEAVFATADSTLSVFNENSLLSRINRNETDIPNREITENIEIAGRVSELSGGRYDITVLPLVEAYGFIDGRQKSVDFDSLRPFIGYKKISVRDGKIHKQHPQTRIDLNSVAKGYLVDRIAEIIEADGADNYLVNVGGEIFCRGNNPDGKPWRIAIDTPIEGNYIQGAHTEAIINVSGMGVATSGNYRNFHTAEDGRKYTHIINPLTGENTESNLLSATVIHTQCAYADAMATMFMVLGMDDSLKLLETHPEIAVLLIYSDNAGDMHQYVSKAMEQYMVR